MTEPHCSPIEEAHVLQNGFLFFLRRHDKQDDDTQHNDIQHNDTEHNDTEQIVHI